MANIIVSWKTPAMVESLKMKSGMSDAEFEVRFGVSPIELEAAKDGRDTIKGWSIMELCKHFGVTPEQMFCEIV